jgi:hypothetical protein
VRRVLVKRLGLVAGAVVLLAAAGASALGATKATTAHHLPPLRTGIFDPDSFASPDAATAFEHTKATGASVVRLIVSWSGVTKKKPANAADPTDPNYDWSRVDAQVQAAVSHGLSPILDVLNAPGWAMSGSPAVPDAAKLGDFATALATHYSGSGMPRVHYFMVWNEPNLSLYFQPQDDTVAVPWYRGAVAAFSAAVHKVHADDVVVAGALAPFGYGIAPMKFLEELLCVSDSGKPTCSDKLDADAWSFHPYTFGGPTHKSQQPGGLSLADLPKAIALIHAAVKAGHVQSHGALQLWVTEFSWDTNPPDPKAVPIALQARWTSEAMYRLWSDGVTLVTWFLLRDQPYPSQPFQAGLYFAGDTIAQDRPKPTLEAFRFPFVAIQGSGKYVLWGRTPASNAANVRIQLKSGSKWKQLMVVHAGAGGVFETTWKTPLKSGSVRAVVGHETSLPFGMKPVPDQAISPFGI